MRAGGRATAGGCGGIGRKGCASWTLTPAGRLAQPPAQGSGQDAGRLWRQRGAGPQAGSVRDARGPGPVRRREAHGRPRGGGGRKERPRRRGRDPERDRAVQVRQRSQVRPPRAPLPPGAAENRLSARGGGDAAGWRLTRARRTLLCARRRSGKSLSLVVQPGAGTGDASTQMVAATASGGVRAAGSAPQRGASLTRVHRPLAPSPAPSPPGASPSTCPRRSGTRRGSWRAWCPATWAGCAPSRSTPPTSGLPPAAPTARSRHARRHAHEHAWEWAGEVCHAPYTAAQIWDVASNRLKLTLTGHIHGVRGLDVSSRHPYLFSCGEDKQVKCASPRLPRDDARVQLLTSFLHHVSVCRLGPGDEPGGARLLRPPQRRVLPVGAPHAGPGHDGRQGRLRAGACHATMHPCSHGRPAHPHTHTRAHCPLWPQVWDMRTRREVHTLVGHKSAVYSVATQSLDPQVISGSMDNTLRVRHCSLNAAAALCADASRARSCGTWRRARCAQC